MRESFLKKLCELATHDERIVLITGDLGFKVLDEFRTKFPRRFINAGVAEQNMTAVATGMALEGFVVFTYSIGVFPTFRCLEQIRNDACYHSANVKIVSVGGGFSYGPLGPSHHATEDLSVMRSIPNMTVLCPCERWEVEQAAAAMVAQHGTSYVRLDKSAGKHTAFPGEKYELGKARIVRDGDDLTFVVTGGIMEEAHAAADELSKDGIGVRILSYHTIKPFDRKTLFDAVSETGRIISIEENTICGGLGSLVAETLLEAGVIPRVFRRIGLREGFSSVVGSQKFLRKRYGMDADAIVQTALEALK